MSEKSAHILTARQKKGSLASVKKPKLPKTVLVKNDVNFWPCLDENQSETFVKLLETSYHDEGFKGSLMVGLSSTLRNIKKSGNVQMLVIANEISPKFFGQHLIATALSKNRNLKIIIVPKLKDATKSLFKVPPVAFSLKNSLKFPEFDDFYSKLGIHAELLKHYCLIQDSINVSVKKEKKEDSDESTQPQVTLLTKTSDSSRSFIPIGTEEVVPAPAPPETPMDTSDFISLSKYDSPSDFLSSSSATPLYRPLKFMKIAGNSNRKKK